LCYFFTRTVIISCLFGESTETEVSSGSQLLDRILHLDDKNRAKYGNLDSIDICHATLIGGISIFKNIFTYDYRQTVFAPYTSFFGSVMVREEVTGIDKLYLLLTHLFLGHFVILIVLGNCQFIRIFFRFVPFLCVFNWFSANLLVPKGRQAIEEK